MPVSLDNELLNNPSSGPILITLEEHSKGKDSFRKSPLKLLPKQNTREDSKIKLRRQLIKTRKDDFI